MTLWQTITWDTARTAGFVAYGLLTLSVALGLALSLRWYSRSWPRWATNDLHRYVTLVTLVFIGIHSLALWLDPFMRFSVAEILVPMASHYRPIWMALGIVAAYLTLALWLSERVQRHIGYGWWRRLHYLTFGVYGLATVHGLGTGSDTRARWAQMIYAGSVVLVFSLLLPRLLGGRPHLKTRPWSAVAAGALVVAAATWASMGPTRPGWNAVANGGHGSGGRVAQASGLPASSTSTLPVPFQSTVQGTIRPVRVGGDRGVAGLRIDSVLSGGVSGRLQVLLQGQVTGGGSLVVERSQVILSPDGGRSDYVGTVSSLDGGHLTATCRSAAGDRVNIDVEITADPTGNVSGTVSGSAA